MAKGLYIGDENNIARKIKKLYVGDENNIARKVKKVYVGDENNIARLVWTSETNKFTKVTNVTKMNSAYADYTGFYSILTDMYCRSTYVYGQTWVKIGDNSFYVYGACDISSYSPVLTEIRFDNDGNITYVKGILSNFTEIVTRLGGRYTANLSYPTLDSVVIRDCHPELSGTVTYQYPSVNSASLSGAYGGGNPTRFNDTTCVFAYNYNDDKVTLRFLGVNESTAKTIYTDTSGGVKTPVIVNISESQYVVFYINNNNNLIGIPTVIDDSMNCYLGNTVNLGVVSSGYINNIIKMSNESVLVYTSNAEVKAVCVRNNTIVSSLSNSLSGNNYSSGTLIGNSTTYITDNSTSGGSSPILVYHDTQSNTLTQTSISLGSTHLDKHGIFLPLNENKVIFIQANDGYFYSNVIELTD